MLDTSQRSTSASLDLPSDVARRGHGDSWRADLWAGLTNGIVSVPQGIAFALLAGVPAIHGLYAMIVPTIVAALVRGSPFLIAGATNTSALVIGALISSLPAARELGPIPVMLFITFCMGAIQLLCAALRLGGMGRFVSQSVLVGFTLGAAVLIAVGQVKNICGLKMSSAPRFLDEVRNLWTQAEAADFRAVGVACLTWAIIAAASRFTRWLPGPLLALLLMGLLTWALGWSGGTQPLRMLDDIPRSGPTFSWPPLQDFALFRELCGPSLALAILGMVETISIGKALSFKARLPFQADRELAAQGLGNVTGALLNCMPSSASWTRSAINLQLGARSRWAGIVAGLTVLALLLLFAPLARCIPYACLGAIILWIAYQMVDLRAARYVWRWSRTDAAVLAITFTSMLVLEIQYAIYLGILVSLIILVRRAGALHMVQMVEAGPGRYREIEIDAQTGKHPVVLLQLEGDLFFGVVDELERRLEQIRGHGARVIVLRLKRAHAIDATAAEALAAFVAHFKAGGGRLILCGLKPEMRARIQASHLGEVLGEENLLVSEALPFRSVQKAIEVARKEVLERGAWSGAGPLIRPAPTGAHDAWSYDI